MFFDGATFLLAFFVILGKRWRTRGLRFALSHWKLSVSSLCAGACVIVLAGTLEGLVMVALALTHLALLVLCLALYPLVKGPRARLSVRFSLAFMMHLLFVLLAPNIRSEATASTTPLWFVDVVARAWVEVLEPLLNWLHAGVEGLKVLDVLAPSLAFIGASLVPLHFLWTYLVLGWFIRGSYFELSESGSPEHLPQPGRALVLVFALSFLLAQGPEAAFGVVLLMQALLALLCGHGLWILSLRVQRWTPTRWQAPLFAALSVVLLIHPPLSILAGLIGVADSIVSAKERVPLYRGAAAWRFSVHLYPRSGRFFILAFVVPLFVFGGVLARDITEEVPRRLALVPEGEGAQVRGEVFSLWNAEGSPFKVDRYEYPNGKGVLPRVGLTPQEAQSLCAAKGARLCEADELALVCSSGRGERFLGGGEQGFFSGETLGRLSSACNFGHVADERVRALRPSGEKEECRGAWGVYDLVGNANEWVNLAHREGFYGLLGSDYRYDDQRLLTCGAHILVPASFIEHLDLSAIGARCCR